MGWRDLACQRIKARGMDFVDVAKAIHTHKANVTKLLNGTGGRHIAGKVGDFLRIGPPFVAVESEEEALAIGAIKKLGPSAQKALADVAAQFLAVHSQASPPKTR